MLKRYYYRAVYFLSWLVFGLGALALALVCVLSLAAPGRKRRERAVRAAIQSLLSIWVSGLRLAGILILSWEGEPSGAWPRPAVYVANHPSLLDAAFLLARLPDALCIYKPALAKSPFLGPAAIAAGYAAGNTGVDLVREIAQKVGGGRTLLIFPEGTRTKFGTACNELKPGFALIARRAEVPIQVLVIRASSDLFAGGQSWWQFPRMPIRYTVTFDRIIFPAPERPIDDVMAEVRSRFQETLSSA